MPRPRFLFVLFDGLRPDMVRADTAPAIHGFRKAWCHYPNASAAFPSETRVQVSAFATGAYPGGGEGSNAGGHGIMGNTFYDPALGFDSPMDTSDTPRMRQAARIYGRLLKAETLAERLHAAGLTYTVLTTGKIGNARLINLDPETRGQAVFSIWGEEVSSPAADFAGVVRRFGPVPEQRLPNTPVAEHAATILLEHMIPTHQADVQVLWLNEPDLSYHYRGIGSPESVEAVRGVDRAFARILDWWQAEGRAAGWQIVAASDHGQITATGHRNMEAELRAAGFKAGKAIGPDVDIAVKRSYAGSLTVRDGNQKQVASLLAWLREQDWLGLSFSREAQAGALPIAALNALNERSPDIYYVLRAGDGANPWGYPGTCICDNDDIPVGGGIHGGLHPSELNNLMIYGGDAFKPATAVETPTAMVDVAPTMLAALGQPVPPTAMGRPLDEAFAGGPRAPAWRDVVLHAEAGGYAQQLTLGAVDGTPTRYLRGARRLS
jgi:phosphonoacetate hydrolase